jgi:hypothetical protein
MASSDLSAFSSTGRYGLQGSVGACGATSDLGPPVVQRRQSYSLDMEERKKDHLST